jgi:ubiquinone biosynthesis protein
VNLSKDIKDINRFRQILTVFFEEGFGFYLSRTKLHVHLPWTKRIGSKLTSTRKKVQAIHLRKAFEQLGPTFIKLGQLLSLRPDLVPLEFCKEFEKLQDHVPSFSFSQVKKIVESELSQPINKLFKRFDKVPIASASVAQVHKAILKNGKVVAVKVQRPNIKEIIDADLDILFFIAKHIEKYLPKLRNFRPVDVVKEFALWTRREINFKNEAKNALRLKEAMAINPNVKIPKVYSEYCSRKVLVLEFIEGAKIDDFSALKKFHINKKKIALTYFTSILQQALIAGFFHADPHPANIFVLKSGKLVYLDYGIVGELSEQDRKKIIDFIKSIPNGDANKSFEIILSMAKEVRNGHIEEFKEKGIKIMKEVYGGSIAEKSVGNGIYEILSLGARYGVIYDPNQILMAKAVYQAEGLGMKLYPQFSVREGFKMFYETYLKEKLSPIKIIKTIGKSLLDHKELLLEFPEHIIKIIEKLEEEKVCPSPVNNQKIEEMEGHIEEKIEERIEEYQHNHNMGLMVLVLLLASFFLLYLEGYQKLFGLSLSTIMIIATLILLLYFVISHKKNKSRY